MSPSENIQYDFEWRPLNNYLAVQRITPPDMRQGSAAEPRLPSEALYEWIVLNGRSPLEGLSLGEHYRLSDYGVAGLALQSAGTVGEALQLIKTNMLLFRKDIRGIAVRRSSCDTVDVDIDLQDKPDWPQSARLYHANVLASAAYAVFRDLLLGELELVRLRLPERNGDVRAYEEYFRVPVYFAGAGITFTLPEQLLEAEIATANSAVFQASLALGSKAFNTRVTREMGGYRQRIVALLEVLQDRYPSIAWVAAVEGHRADAAPTARRRGHQLPGSARPGPPRQGAPTAAGRATAHRGSRREAGLHGYLQFSPRLPSLDGTVCQRLSPGPPRRQDRAAPGRTLAGMIPFRAISADRGERRTGCTQPGKKPRAAPIRPSRSLRRGRTASPAGKRRD